MPMIKSAASFVLGLALMNVLGEKAVRKVNRRAEKCNQLYKCACRMLRSFQDQKSMEEALLKLGIGETAIYGYGELGQILVRELAHSKCRVKYIIESKRKEIEGFVCYAVDEELPEADAVIVTPIWDYDNIKQQLTGRIDRIISLNDLLNELEQGNGNE